MKVSIKGVEKKINNYRKYHLHTVQKYVIIRHKGENRWHRDTQVFY